MSIRSEIAKDVAIEMAQEILADFDARRPVMGYDPDDDTGLWHAAAAGSLASALTHLLEVVSVPGLIEHTAAACDTITKAATA